VASEPIDSRAHRVLSGVSRVAVLEVVRASGPLDVQAIAELVGLHPNTVRSHLDRLIEAHLVDSSIALRATPGRPRLLFSAPLRADAHPDESYRMLARILAEAVRAGAPAGARPADAAARAGKRWGEQVAQTGREGVEPLDAGDTIDRIVALLDEVGFAPTLAADVDQPATPTAAAGPAVIELHRCPFIDVAREHSDVVCAVHLGLMQGALEQMQAPPTTIRLLPLVRPDLCLVHLAPVGVGSQP
jgi:predicted ArsR family transcriptional regulator